MLIITLNYSRHLKKPLQWRRLHFCTLRYNSVQQQLSKARAEEHKHLKLHFVKQRIYQLTYNIKNLLSLRIVIFSCVALSFLACSSSDKNSSCERFRQGKFRYHFRWQNEQTDFLIQRNDSVQTEMDLKSGETSKLAIRWTGECDYELRLLETTFDFPDSMQEIRESLPVKTKILSSAEDYYIFQTTRDNSDLVLTDTLWIEK